MQLSPPWLLVVLAAALAAALPSAAAEPAAASAAPEVAAVLVRVDDLEAGLEFYQRVAGFEVRHRERHPGLVELANGEVALFLVPVARPVRHEYPPSAESHLNVQVESLERTLAELERHSVRRLVAEPLTAVIGPNLPITDPAGNVVYVLELTGHEGPLPRPRIFNFGITVPDMEAARAFYEGVLGFAPSTEEFYPPVIPYVPAGALSVVLHESATGASQAPAPDTAQVNLVLRVDDLARATERLAAAGVTVRRGPAILPGQSAEIVDPFGNVHLLLEETR